MVHTHVTERDMNDEKRWAKIISGQWRQSAGEKRTTINGKDYTYGWFADACGKCMGHAYYCHTDDMFVFKPEGS